MRLLQICCCILCGLASGFPNMYTLCREF